MDSLKMTDKVAIKVYFPNETYKSIVVVKDMQCKDIKSKLSRGLQGGKSNESDDDSRDYQLLEVNGEESRHYAEIRQIPDDELVLSTVQMQRDKGIAETAKFLFKRMSNEDVTVTLNLTLNVSQLSTIADITQLVRNKLKTEDFSNWTLSSQNLLTMPRVSQRSDSAYHTSSSATLDLSMKPLWGRSSELHTRSFTFKKPASQTVLMKVYIRNITEMPIALTVPVDPLCTMFELMESVLQRLKKIASKSARASTGDAKTEEFTVAGHEFDNRDSYELILLVGTRDGPRVRILAPHQNVLDFRSSIETDVNDGRVDWYKVAVRRKGADDAFLPEESGGQIPIAAEGASKYGYLVKEGHLRKNWKRRLFCIKGSFLYYYRSEMETSPAGVIDLTECTFKVDDALSSKHPHCFVIDNAAEKRQTNIAASSDTELQEWIMALRAAVATSPADAKANYDDFEWMKVLGKGASGKVMLARHKPTNLIYAVKVIRKDDVMQNDRFLSTRTEWAILKRARHPFLVKLYYSFTTSDRLYLVLDYVRGGELFFHLQNEGKFSEARARFYTAEIVMAVEHLHKCGIVFRDLKPENILLEEDGHLKLTDFGLAKENVNSNAGCQTFCGTPEYLAPEVLVQQSYGRPVDWWCLGITLYEMLTGRHPFYSTDREHMYMSVLRDELELPYYLSPDAKNILEGLLTRNPDDRLGSLNDADDIKAHPWFKGIDWKKEIEPPFRPHVRDRADVSNFDQEFTKEAPELSPTNSNLNDNADQFAGFTYYATNLNPV